LFVNRVNTALLDILKKGLLLIIDQQEKLYVSHLLPRNPAETAKTDRFPETGEDIQRRKTL
jgi:hypothetical protein